MERNKLHVTMEAAMVRLPNLLRFNVMQDSKTYLLPTRVDTTSVPQIPLFSW